MTAIADLFTKYVCTNCQEEVQGIRVKCAECENFDLCLQCFAAGAEIGAHLNSHSYQFMDTGTTILSIFRGKGAYTARESLRLLDAVEQYGYGNWEDVSRYIETRSAEDAKEEYVSKWINGTIGVKTWAPAESQRPVLVDNTVDDEETSLIPLDITTEEAAQVGYMPNRDGFERECLPLAERGISSITYSTEDSEAEVALKLALVDTYTRRLRERARRKRVMKEHQLAARFFRESNSQQNELTKELKEFRDRFRVFAQFYKSSDFEQIIPSLAREKDLRLRFAELCRYRQNGIKKLDDCRHFEQHAALAPQQANEPYGIGKTDNSQNSIGNQSQHTSAGHSQSAKRIKTESLSDVDENQSSHVQKRMHHTGDPSYCGALSHNKNYTDNYQTATNSTLTQQNKRKTNAAASSNSNFSINQTPPPKSDTKDEFGKIAKYARNGNGNGNGNGVSEWKSSVARNQIEAAKKMDPPLGSDLLNANEKKLCNTYQISPTEYFSLKTAILSRAPLPMNPTPAELAIRNYFVNCGWLRI